MHVYINVHETLNQNRENGSILGQGSDLRAEQIWPYSEKVNNRRKTILYKFENN